MNPFLILQCYAIRRSPAGDVKGSLSTCPFRSGMQHDGWKNLTRKTGTPVKSPNILTTPLPNFDHSQFH